MLKFTSDHEWILVENDSATVGITQHAQEQLGDLVFVQLPKPGTTLSAGGAAAVVESVKAASDVYAPVNGEVIEVNQALNDNPALVNSDPMNAGWLFKLKVVDCSQFDKLMDEQSYKALIGQS
ncbi:MAG TPA: glycine cleavage system protein GcvH [Pseudolabrys sp.]|nr:glycine cleavage system protein GcvH [Pseudolabrys sp.]